MRTTAAAFALALVTACGSPSRDVLVRADAGVDAADAADAAPPPADAAPDADPTLGGPCVDDKQCDDGLACTVDTCDPARKRCRTIPDDSACDDHVYCNGRERCVLAQGCAAGPVQTCEDGTACTIDTCVEATQACAHDPRDIDRDGDEDDHCAPGKDCNDADPSVASTHAEVCKNGKDDNCDGAVDETPCTTVQYDTCATGEAITAPGTYTLSTVGAKADYTATCGVTTASSAHDVVALVTIPAGPNRDLDLWATVAGTEVAIAVQGTCGQAATELACGAGGGTTTRARARNLAPGTYAVVVTTQLEATVDLAVDLRPASTKAANETCATATPLTVGTPFTVELIDATKDLASACTSQTGELVYALTLAAPADVKIFSQLSRGAGTPVVELRDAGCTLAANELRCTASTALPVFARNLAAGTYYVAVAASEPLDASITVALSAPTASPPDQTCATAPAAPLNLPPTLVSLVDHEAAIKDGCNPGRPNAAYAVPLAVPSDVLVIGRFPQNETGGVAFDHAGCTPADNIVCASDTTPVRLGRRAVPAGDYRVVLSDTLGEVDSLSVLVRPTVAPTIVGSGADRCADALDIPATGGFFTGDTTKLAADFPDGCDAPSSGGSGAPDQVLRLVLADRRRVVFDMEGSVYSTILDVRTGTTCPGLEVPGACYVGLNGPRSFLDLTLDAGTYWVVIDGYAGAVGAWNLDVRVLSP
jgi:hypothetical protein